MLPIFRILYALGLSESIKNEIFLSLEKATFFSLINRDYSFEMSAVINDVSITP